MAKKKSTKKAMVSKPAPEKVEAKKPTLAYERAHALLNAPEYQQPLEQLKKYRKEGEYKVLRIKDENINIRINKMLGKAGKKKLLALNKGEMASAKGIVKQNAINVETIVKKQSTKIKQDMTPIFAMAKKEYKAAMIAAKNSHRANIAKIKKEHEADLVALKAKYKNNKDPKNYKIDSEAVEISYKSKLNAEKNAYFDATQTAKENKYKTYQEYYEYTSQLRLNKHTVAESVQYDWQTYVRNFNFVNWLTKNALILIMIVFFAILAVISQGQILAPSFLLDSFASFAPKMFLALGVAGLILLGGTDLSVGRMCGVGVAFTLMIVGANDKFFPFLAGVAVGGRIVIGLLVSIVICTLFSTAAGFFTAKFKMHPFISTLASQLIIFGLFQFIFAAGGTFSLVGDASNIFAKLAGDKGAFIVIYAIIAVLVVWYIWNKTKFGKNLYAVGGNQEAAAVSGISPFKITIIAFAMAGVLYGLGGFMQALYSPTGNFTSGQGFETDAIAACVIGGVSFSGGVGTIGGVVIGVVILGFLSSCFAYLKIDTNLVFAIKGLIILTAVTLDCIKYIRKK